VASTFAVGDSIVYVSRESPQRRSVSPTPKRSADASPPPRRFRTATGRESAAARTMHPLGRLGEMCASRGPIYHRAWPPGNVALRSMSPSGWGYLVDNTPPCSHLPVRESLPPPAGCSSWGHPRMLSTWLRRLSTGCSASVDNRQAPVGERGRALLPAAGTRHFQGESTALPRESIHSTAACVTARGSS
jgi:hypothetical protein